MKSIRKLLDSRGKRLTALAVVLVILIPLVLRGLLLTKESAAAWFDDNYAYRQRFSFTHNAAIIEPRRITVSLDTAELISSGVMQADCDDTRFTDGNGKLLRYQLTGTCNNAATTYEVVFETILNGENPGYLYYGNPSAASASQDVSDVAELTPSGGDPAIADRTNEEKGPAPALYFKFDEGYETTAQDSSANDNDGNISGATWQTEDLCLDGKCLFFDGADDLVTVTNSDTIDFDAGLSDEVTFLAWIRVNSDGENNVGQVFSKGASTYLRVTNEGADGLADLEASLDLATNDATLAISNAITLNRWHHVAFSYSDDGDDEITVYVDAVNKGSSTNGDGSPAGDANDLLVGGSSAANFHGFVDEFKVYPYERSSDAIKTDFIQGASLHGSSAVFGRGDQSYLSDGLVGYWKMDEASWTNDCSATSVVDSSGNGNNALSCPASTGPTTAAGKFGNGGDFDGDDDYLTDSSNPTPSIVSQGTITAWVKPDATGSLQFITNASVGGRNYLVRMANGNLGVRMGDMSADYDTGTSIPQDSWSLVGLSWNTNTWYAYLNGSQISLGIYGIGGPEGSLYIGDYGNGAANFAGIIDEARIYNRALSPAEVKALYEWAPGPVGYWKMEERSDGTSAVTRYDSSGYENNLTDENTTTSTQGKFGTAAYFEAADNEETLMISDSNQNGLDITGPLTISAWVKPDSFPNIINHIVNKSITEDDTQHSYRLYVSSAGQVRFGVSNTGTTWTTVSSTSNISSGEWLYLAGVYDGSYLKIFVNGVLANTPTSYSSGIFNGTAGFFIGAQEWTIGRRIYPFDGAIDEVKIYNYARTTQQIVKDMNAGHPAPGSPVGSALGHWKFDEGYGTTANDSGTGGNNGTISGATWYSSGKLGKALDFGGSSYVQVADNDSFSFGNSSTDSPFSISAWIKKDGNVTGDIVSKYTTSGIHLEYRLRVTNLNHFTFTLYDDSAGGSRIGRWANDSLPSGASDWMHMVATYDGSASLSGIKLYLDGVRVDDADSTSGTYSNMDNTSAPLAIGAHTTDGTPTSVFDGKIDDVRIYNSELTQEQINIVMNYGSSITLGGVLGDSEASTLTDGEGAPPVAHWNFDEKTGTSANDKSGNGNTGTITGAVWRGAGDCKTGACLAFDGSNDYVDIGAGPSTVRSVSIWVYPATTTEYFINLTSNTDYIWVNGGTITATGLSSPIIYVNGQVTSTLEVNKWQHITVTTSTAENASNLDIGRTQDTNYFEGKIDEVKLYDYIRTPAQIAYDYNRGAPVGYWKFDECQGTTAHDASGNGNSGTISAGDSTGSNDSVGTCSGSAGEMWADGATGKRNSSLEFDGTNDQVNITDNANLRFDSASQDFSIFAWIKRTSFGSAHVIVNKRDSGTDGWSLIAQSSNLVTCQLNGTLFISTSTISDSQWHHVGCTIDRDGNGQVYIDGKADGSPVAAGSAAMSTTSNIRIGGNSYDTGRPFPGQIDDVRIYNYALSETQIKTIMNEGAVFFGPSEGSP